MRRPLNVLACALAALALVVAAFALHQARQPTPTPSVGEVQAAGIQQFTDAGNRMTPAQVLQRLGKPTEVYRDNPRALCWRYDAPYEVKMCWGPKRKQAWIFSNAPVSGAGNSP